MALTQSSALHGLGGVGKTQIALEYAYRHALEYGAVFWIEAENEETVVSSLLRIATLPDHWDVLFLSGSPPVLSPLVIFCHSLVYRRNSPPDARRAGAINTTPSRFELRGKGAPGEGKAFLLLLCPVFIGLPQIP